MIFVAFDCQFMEVYGQQLCSIILFQFELRAVRFAYMGTLNPFISMISGYWNVSFLDDFCPISYWGVNTMVRNTLIFLSHLCFTSFTLHSQGKKQELAAKSISTLEHRLARVELYLDDIESKGFFNWCVSC